MIVCAPGRSNATIALPAASIATAGERWSTYRNPYEVVVATLCGADHVPPGLWKEACRVKLESLVSRRAQMATASPEAFMAMAGPAAPGVQKNGHTCDWTAERLFAGSQVGAARAFAVPASAATASKTGTARNLNALLIERSYPPRFRRVKTG
jgi:hypothetical protein